MLRPACARSQGGVLQVVIHRAILTRGLAQVLNFTQYSGAIGGEKFFSDAHKANDAAVGRDSEGVGHKILNQGGVAFVGRRLDLGREGSDGENVGGFKRAGIEEAGGVGEGDEDRGGGAGVALREMLGKVCEENVFILHLRKRSARARRVQARRDVR